LAQEVSDRAAAVTAEEAARIAADTSLTNAIAALQSDVDGNEADADAAIAAEETRALAAELALQTALDDEEARALAAEAVLAASVATEEAARIAGDAALTNSVAALSGAVAADFAAMETDMQSALSAEEAARIAADATLTSNLAAEATLARSEEARIEAKHDAHFAGLVEVAYLTEADANMGVATHYIVNASSPKSFTVPTMGEGYFIMVKVAEGSNSVVFNAGAGESIDGEADGSITLHGGASVMFVKKGGVMYLF